MYHDQPSPGRPLTRGDRGTWGSVLITKCSSSLLQLGAQAASAPIAIGRFSILTITEDTRDPCRVARLAVSALRLGYSARRLCHSAHHAAEHPEPGGRSVEGRRRRGPRSPGRAGVSRLSSQEGSSGGPHLTSACSLTNASQVKCDGKQPCHKCSSREQDCEYPGSRDNASASR